MGHIFCNYGYSKMLLSDLFINGIYSRLVKYFLLKLVRSHRSNIHSAYQNTKLKTRISKISYRTRHDLITPMIENNNEGQ